MNFYRIKEKHFRQKVIATAILAKGEIPVENRKKREKGVRRREKTMIY